MVLGSIPIYSTKRMKTYKVIRMAFNKPTEIRLEESNYFTKFYTTIIKVNFLVIRIVMEGLCAKSRGC